MYTNQALPRKDGELSSYHGITSRLYFSKQVELTNIRVRFKEMKGVCVIYCFNVNKKLSLVAVEMAIYFPHSNHLYIVIQLYNAVLWLFEHANYKQCNSLFRPEVLLWLHIFIQDIFLFLVIL